MRDCRQYSVALNPPYVPRAEARARPAGPPPIITMSYVFSGEMGGIGAGGAAAVVEWERVKREGEGEERTPAEATVTRGRLEDAEDATSARAARRREEEARTGSARRVAAAVAVKARRILWRCM